MTHGPEEKMQIKFDDVVWRKVGDELVVLELATSTYLTMNGTARYLWESLADGASSQSLAEALVSRYDIPAHQAQADVRAFVESLSERNLLVGEE